MTRREVVRSRGNGEESEKTRLRQMRLRVKRSRERAISFGQELSGPESHKGGRTAPATLTISGRMAREVGAARIAEEPLGLVKEALRDGSGTQSKGGFATLEEGGGRYEKGFHFLLSALGAK